MHPIREFDVSVLSFEMIVLEDLARGGVQLRDAACAEVLSPILSIRLILLHTTRQNSSRIPSSASRNAPITSPSTITLAHSNVSMVCMSKAAYLSQSARIRHAFWHVMETALRTTLSTRSVLSPSTAPSSSATHSSVLQSARITSGSIITLA